MLIAVTLIGYPERPLTEADVEAASTGIRKLGFSINGKEWLFENEACDLFVEGEVEMAREALTPWSIQHKLDVIVQNYQGRRKKALLADMESTIIQNEMLDEMADRVGIGPQVAAITLRSMEGEIDFKVALIERLALLKDQPLSMVQELINKIVYTPGAKELIGTLKKQGVRTVLVSGGFTVFTEVVARKLRFDENYGNNLSVRDQRITGLPVDPILGPAAKLDRLKTTAKLQNIKESDICAIGDGANDIPMIMAAGMGISYHGKPKVVEKATHAIRFANLRAILWAQGYRKEDLA